MTFPTYNLLVLSNPDVSSRYDYWNQPESPYEGQEDPYGDGGYNYEPEVENEEEAKNDTNKPGRSDTPNL